MKPASTQSLLRITQASDADIDSIPDRRQGDNPAFDSPDAIAHNPQQ
jgi:hypothetical protein